MTNASLVTTIEAIIMEDIISDKLPPSSPLRISQIAQRTSTGATPVREALSRLLSKGLVEWTANKGFRVCGISRDDLQDLVIARTAVEVEALRLSMEKGDDRWEAGIVAANHRLKLKLAAHDGHPTFAEVEPVHNELHMAMLQACGSPRLLEMADQLAMKHSRYQRLASFRDVVHKHSDVLIRFAEEIPAGVIDEPAEFYETHDILVNVIISRQSTEAQEILRGHLRLILNYLDANPFWNNYTR